MLLVAAGSWLAASTLLLLSAPLCQASAVLLEEDVVALVQQSAAVRSQEVEPRPWKLRTKELEEFPPLPPLDQVANQINDAVDDITEQVGDIADDLSDKADEAVGKGVDWVVEHGTKAIEKISGILTKELKYLEADAEKLMDRAIEARDKLQKEFNVTNLPPDVLSRQILQKFEDKARSVLESASGSFGLFAGAVKLAGTAVTTGLGRSGQKALSTKLNNTISSALLVLDSMQARIIDLQGRLAASANTVAGNYQPFLEELSQKVCSALNSVLMFSDLFQQAFQDASDYLTDAISSRLPAEVTGRVYEAFSSVNHVGVAIAWRLRAAKRELVLAINQAIADVAAVLKLSPDPVHTCLSSASPTGPETPVPPLGDGTAEERLRSGAHAVRQQLAAVSFAALALALRH